MITLIVLMVGAALKARSRALTAVAAAREWT
jgi:hypothetical protein